jgi:predicted O-methyltransferase YrrM
MRLKIYNKVKSIVELGYDYIYSKFIFNKAQVIFLENEKYSEYFSSRDGSIKILNKILNKTHNRVYNEEKDSAHWPIFAALTKVKKINRILEIGTYTGEFTAILSRLFPDAEIVTLDLPESDPILRNTYKRDDDALYDNFKSMQDENLQHSKNVKFILTNSFFLNVEEYGKFDLIWVDGGHNYPEVAWDLCNSYNALNDKGVLMCDDVIKMNTDYAKGFVSTDSFRVLEYINERVNGDIVYFLKRLDGKRYARKVNRKYVSFFEKK